MTLSAFEQTNLRSRKVRLFLYLLLVVLLGYGVGFAIYWTRPVPERAMRAATRAAGCLALASMLFVFFLVLRWHILRTAILGLSLLGLGFLYCALVLVVFQNPAAHAAVLLTFGVLFIVLFITQSNLSIYMRDKTYADACLEGLIALGFAVSITLMISEALGMN